MHSCQHSSLTLPLLKQPEKADGTGNCGGKEQLANSQPRSKTTPKAKALSAVMFCRWSWFD